MGNIYSSISSAFGNNTPFIFILFILLPVYSIIVMLLKYNRYKFSLLCVLLIIMTYVSIIYSVEMSCNKNPYSCSFYRIITFIATGLFSLIISAIYFISLLFQSGTNTSNTNISRKNYD